MRYVWNVTTPTTVHHSLSWMMMMIIYFAIAQKNTAVWKNVWRRLVSNENFWCEINKNKFSITIYNIYCTYLYFHISSVSVYHVYY